MLKIISESIDEMMNSKEMKDKSYLLLLDKELIEKIPLSVRKLIEDERDKDYKVILNPNLSLEEQNLLVETYNILGVLN